MREVSGVWVVECVGLNVVVWVTKFESVTVGRFEIVNVVEGGLLVNVLVGEAVWRAAVMVCLLGEKEYVIKESECELGRTSVGV